jgi:hypothetical protein
MSESALQVRVMGFCKVHGFLALKFSSPAHAGVPDLVILGNGKTIFYELKNPNGKGRLTELQKVTHEKMRAHGAEVYVGHDYPTITSTILARLG